MNCQMWITLSQMQVLLNLKLSCIFFEDDEAVIKMVSKSYDETRDGLFDTVNMLTQRTNLLTC